MNIYLLNDTSKQHAGCKSVMRVLRGMLSDHTIIGTQYCNETDISPIGWAKSDCVICNGEGTLHHNRPIGNQLLDRLAEAQNLGKKTLLLNAVFQNTPPYYSDVIKKLDLFTVREVLSYENAVSCGGNPSIYLDLCSEEIYNTPKEPPYKSKVVVGCSGATVQFHKEFSALSKSMDYPTVLIEGESMVYPVSQLHGCKAYITGQHHGMYAALIAKVPFILVSSNSHKIEGLLKWANSKIPVCSKFSEVTDMSNNILDYKEEYARIFEWFDSAPRLTKSILNEVLRSDIPLH